jgi:Bacterial SH3 domain
MKILLAILCTALFVTAAVGQERYVRPVDEASQDGSFLAFRNKLIAAAERRDIKHVIGILDPKVELSYGGHVGVKGFRQLWKNESEFWEEFLPVIKNGGRFSNDAGSKIFSAPYVFTDFPEDLDNFEYFMIFGSDVNLRAAPRTDAEVVTKLSYNIIKLEEEPRPTGEGEKRPDWFKVRTLGGQGGYVNRKYFRSPIDHRAGFEKKRGVWKMIYFIAGD